MEGCTSIKCSLPGKLSPLDSALIIPLIDFCAKYFSKMSHKGSFVASHFLMEMRELSLDIPRLGTVLFRKRIPVGAKRPAKVIDGLIEFCESDFSNFPTAKCKKETSVTMGTIAKQQAVYLKAHCNNNLFKRQNNVCADFFTMKSWRKNSGGMLGTRRANVVAEHMFHMGSGMPL